MRVARPVIALLSGLLFGIGLFVSGMSNPAKVQAFLDVFGAWDPSLGLVMAAALGVVIVEFHGARAIDRSFVGEPFHWPEPQPVDFPLLVGSVVFGVGWGIAGLCPGAALVGLGLGQLPAAVFVTAMLLGIALVGQMTDDRGQ